MLARCERLHFAHLDLLIAQGRPSVRPSVRPLARPPVRPSARPEKKLSKKNQKNRKREMVMKHGF